MHLIIGKDNCNLCNILKNLLDEKGVRYSYLDREVLPPATTGYLKMYCTSYPMILKITNFSCFHDCITILTICNFFYYYYDIIIIIIIIIYNYFF